MCSSNEHIESNTCVFIKREKNVCVFASERAHQNVKRKKKPPQQMKSATISTFK